MKIIKKILHQGEYGRIFPRGQAPIITVDENQALQLIDAEFSLIPSWWDPSRAPKKTKTNRPTFATHNARLESITEKPTFKNSFLNNHCVVPIRSFFESSLFGSQFAGNRIELRSSSYLFAAGCFANWMDKTSGEVVTSFTIITHNPSMQIFLAGHDRMPVFLSEQDAVRWLHMPKSKGQELVAFLEASTIRKELKLEIEVDRPLKEGWQKNSPREEELAELQRQLHQRG